MAQDLISEGRIIKLHPAIRQIALVAYRQSVAATPVGIHPFITEGTRTFKRSDELWRLGRDNYGNIINKKLVVSDAKGGQSYHNYGLGLDFVNLVNGKMIWTVDSNWMKVVEIFRKHGFQWGGEFPKPDAPHFQMRFGFHWRELLERYKAGKLDCEGYVLLN